MTTKHTQTPWYDAGAGREKHMIYASVNGVPKPVADVGWSAEAGQDKANAAYIVRAVNAHEGLVRALASIAEDCRRGAHELGMTPAGVQDIASRCDAALSAAKE